MKRMTNKAGWVALMVALGTVTGAQQAWALSLADHAVFAQNSVSIGNNVVVHQGGIGTNNELLLINIGNNGSYQFISGGGSLQKGNNGSFVGSLVLNDDVNLGSGTIIQGDIHSAGDVKLDNNAQVLKNLGVGGNITATGNVTLGNSNVVQGSVTAGGHVKTGNNTHVDGNIDAQGNVTLGNNNSINGVINHGGSFSHGNNLNYPNEASTGQNPATANPIQFQTIALPSQSAASTGGANNTYANNASANLIADDYGTFGAGNNFNLNLGAGLYDFDSFALGNNATIDLDLSSNNPIHIIVGGDLILGNNLNMRLSADGVNYRSLGQILNDDDLFALTENILWEVHGKVQIGNSINFLGTILHTSDTQALTYNASGNNSAIIGAMYSTNAITIGNNTNIYFSPAHYLAPVSNPPPGQDDPDDQNITHGSSTQAATPEPATAMLGLIGAGALGLASRRRRA